MAKRASKDEFNMAAEIRGLLTQNKKLKGRQVIAAIQEKYPKQVINKNSASVAFANARKALGIRAPGKVTRRRRPNRAAAPRPVAASAPVISLQVLQAAKALLEECKGDSTAASNALKSVAMLQMK